MNIRHSTITIPSRWELPTTHRLETQQSNRQALAVIFPGANYPVDAPLLHYARRAALDNGCDVLSLEYGFQANRVEIQPEDMPALADEAVQALGRLSQDYETIIFVSKSLGTVVASHARLGLDRPIRHHIFLTPLPGAIESMQETLHAMVVVGTADALFDRDHIARVSALTHVKLHAVPHANHAMEVGNVDESLRILRDVTQWCAGFFRTHIPPGPTC